ncbi:MAG: NADP-dependent malic enzyme [Burkholderiaceae bacterium]
MAQTPREAALDYHRFPTPGKIAVVPTKSMATQRDLSLAYSPGVAEACMAIHADPAQASSLTARGNLVAVITNGTAVLGLGNIGPLAGKPVMEGKGCLFKKFAGIDVFDIELAETDPDALVDTIARLEPTFGGINLEDIKAPECFIIERRLRERMKIPVFHDDQHGTAIVAAAALLNALTLVGKQPADVRLVCSGAGAAAIACLDLMVSLGLAREHILVCDSRGVIHAGRTGLDEFKSRYVADTGARTLADAVRDADVFLGLSQAGVLTGEMVKTMAQDPVILAMANPDPEIRPEDALAARPDAILGTGRSDYPNQVNNVLCFPFVFRGALDVGATTINEAMKLAAVKSLAALARKEIPDVVADAYGTPGLRFGREYLIPKPFDPRLIDQVAPAVAQAAMDSGVATRPIADMRAYRQQLRHFVYKSADVMSPVYSAAKALGDERAMRVAFAEGEDERVLRAVRIVVDEGLARPVLVGRARQIAETIDAAGLDLRAGEHFDLLELADGPLPAGIGLADLDAPALARLATERAAVLLRTQQVEAALCGTVGRFADHLEAVRRVIGPRKPNGVLASMQMLILPDRQLFICDTQINHDPDAQTVAEIALLAAEAVRGFGKVPRAALLSHSHLGSSDAGSARKMRAALDLIRAADPDLEVAGEVRADTALSRKLQQREDEGFGLTDEANLLIMPNIDAANIAYNLLRMVAGNGLTVGGVLLGAARPIHIMTPSSTVRRIVNMTAVAVASAV